MWTQKNVILRGRWTWVAGFTWDFCEAKHDSHKFWKSNATFFIKYPKSIISKFFSNHPKSTTQESFFRDRNPGKLHVIFFWIFAMTKGYFIHHTNNRKYEKRRSSSRMQERFFAGTTNLCPVNAAWLGSPTLCLQPFGRFSGHFFPHQKKRRLCSLSFESEDLRNSGLFLKSRTSTYWGIHEAKSPVPYSVTLLSQLHSHAKILQMNFSFYPFSLVHPISSVSPRVDDWSTMDADAVCNRLEWSSTSLLALYCILVYGIGAAVRSSSSSPVFSPCILTRSLWVSVYMGLCLETTTLLFGRKNLRLGNDMSHREEWGSTRQQPRARRLWLTFSGTHFSCLPSGGLPINPLMTTL